MEMDHISDDFFRIGNIAILQRKTGNASYDFDFRNHFECRSVIGEIDEPVLLHIGAVENYSLLEEELDQMGSRLLVSEKEHLKCSTIEKWYPPLEDKTPYTRIYDELPPLEGLKRGFSFPVFIKGNRQTSHHIRKNSIIRSDEEYEKLCRTWPKDKILSWQKVAVREYIQLELIDDTSFPEMVPICYEFRFFYFEGKCMAYGPYWNMGRSYELREKDKKSALALADWVSDRLGAQFVAIDLAKTAHGEWIVIEVNDAQESGFVGINPIILWNNTIEAMQV